MKEEIRTITIPLLDELAIDAEIIRIHIQMLHDMHLQEHDQTLADAALAGYNEVRALKNASDVLKQAGFARIERYVTHWYHSRLDEETTEQPAYESITYTGDNTWIIVMTTSTYGKERITVQSDTATWEQVYDTGPA